MRSGSSLVRVHPSRAGGWDIREAGSERVLGHTAQENSAVLRAQAIMDRAGIVEVLDPDGLVVRTYAIPAPGEGPWWYMPRRPLFWVLGGWFVLQGMVGLVISDASQTRFWLGLLMLVSGGFGLGLAGASRRRDRRLLSTKN